MQKRVWITWENQRRSIELATALSCDFFLLEYKGWVRYPKSIFKTISILSKKKQDVVFVQNPSMVLATLGCLYKLITGVPVVVDRHTTFLLNKAQTNTPKLMLFKALHYFTIRTADMTIITNRYLAKIVRRVGGRPFILPDKLPKFKHYKKIDLGGKKNILLISSFGEDEPLCQVIEAMNDFIEDDTYLYITGNYKKLDAKLPKKVPRNIIFTGFIPEQQFIDMLFSVDIAMALTTADYCMLCGCYEIVSAEKPLITSDQKTLKDYFDRAVFVDNTSSGISKGIREVMNNLNYYTDQSKKMKKEISQKWEKLYDDLESYLS